MCGLGCMVNQMNQLQVLLLDPHGEHELGATNMTVMAWAQDAFHLDGVIRLGSRLRKIKLGEGQSYAACMLLTGRI